MVFVKSKYVLPKKIPKNSDFVALNSALASDKKEVANTIILHLYKSNTQIRREKQLDPYHKVDTTMFWFVNIVSCRWRLILACSIQASAFTMLCPLDYCNNCIYKGDQNRNVPVNNIHDITARQFICYFDSKDWKSQEILVEYNWLVVQQAHQV